MSITRKFLTALGIEADKIDEIITAHTETVDALKTERDKFKVDAEKLPVVQKELDDLKTSTADYEDLKKKYADEHQAFEDFKKDIETTNNLNKVKDAYKALLVANNVDNKRLDTILKVTDLSSKTLNKDGKFDDEKSIVDAIKSEWGDFIVTTESKGAKVETPPTNSGSKALSKEEIMKIKDSAERQKAIAENIDLFE